MMINALTAIATSLAALSLTLTGCGMPAGDTPLTRAVDAGDARTVRSLIAQGNDPDGKDGFGMTPLVRASRRGDAASIKALLEGGADPNLVDRPPSREGWTPLMNAVHKNRKQAVGVLLAAGADPNRTTAGGMTALMLAAGDTDVAIVRLLLDAGADPRPGTNGSAALTNAVLSGRVQTVKALLEKAPGLRLEAGFKGAAVSWLCQLRGGGEALRIVEANRIKR